MLQTTKNLETCFPHLSVTLLKDKVIVVESEGDSQWETKSKVHLQKIQQIVNTRISIRQGIENICKSIVSNDILLKVKAK